MGARLAAHRICSGESSDMERLRPVNLCHSYHRQTRWRSAAWGDDGADDGGWGWGMMRKRGLVSGPRRSEPSPNLVCGAVKPEAHGARAAEHAACWASFVACRALCDWRSLWLVSVLRRSEPSPNLVCRAVKPEAHGARALPSTQLAGHRLLRACSV
jgi:hypothetical protein